MFSSNLALSPPDADSAHSLYLPIVVKTKTVSRHVGMLLAEQNGPEFRMIAARFADGWPDLFYTLALHVTTSLSPTGPPWAVNFGCIIPV